mmetsp:Transcript_68268/g.158434  ORF Transcript_68268/g.158434 Transcript_68268/m.158434 type:complete len:288 (+) Transcript_68268:2-865(+)
MGMRVCVVYFHASSSELLTMRGSLPKIRVFSSSLFLINSAMFTGTSSGGAFLLVFPFLPARNLMRKLVHLAFACAFLSRGRLAAVDDCSFLAFEPLALVALAFSFLSFVSFLSFGFLVLDFFSFSFSLLRGTQRLASLLWCSLLLGTSSSLGGFTGPALGRFGFFLSPGSFDFSFTALLSLARLAACDGATGRGPPGPSGPEGPTALTVPTYLLASFSPILATGGLPTTVRPVRPTWGPTGPAARPTGGPATGPTAGPAAGPAVRPAVGPAGLDEPTEPTGPAGLAR